MYYCMTGRAIQGNIPFKIDRIARPISMPKGGTVPRSRTEYFPVLPNPRIAIIDLLYEFRVTIVTGTNERALG